MESLAKTSLIVSTTGFVTCKLAESLYHANIKRIVQKASAVLKDIVRLKKHANLKGTVFQVNIV